jgi:hypothetical protein
VEVFTVSLGEKWITPDMQVGYHLANVNDFGPSGLTLTATGVTFPEDGFGSACANFVGTTNTLDRATALTTIASDWTISYWVKFATVADATNYAMCRVSTASAVVAYRYTRSTLSRAGAVYTWNVYPSTTTPITYVIPNFSLNKWYHMVITHVGSTNTITTYFEGNFANTVVGGTSVGTNFIRLGYDSSVTRLLGRIDEFVVYAHTFTPQDIRRLYAEGKGLLV